MQRKNYGNEEEDDDGQVQCDSWGDPPPFWDDNDNDNDDTDNDVDVEGLCFQHVHARHRRHTQAFLALQPHNGGGEQLLCQEDN